MVIIADTNRITNATAAGASTIAASLALLCVCGADLGASVVFSLLLPCVWPNYGLMLGQKKRRFPALSPWTARA